MVTPETEPRNDPEGVPETVPGTTKYGRGQSPNSQANLLKGDWRKKKGEDPEATVEAGNGESDQLADMRHVYSHPEKDDRTPGQKICRKWLKEDVGGFMKHKSALETKLPAKPVPPGAGPEWDGKGLCPTCGNEVLVNDEGSERCLDLIDRLLKDKEWLNAP